MKFTILLTFLSTFLFSQEFTFDGYTYDKIDSTSCEFVCVINISNNQGYYTDVDGYFALQASIGDTILFSSVEFEKDTLILKNDIDDFKIYLTKLVIELPEVSFGEVPQIVSFNNFTKKQSLFTAWSGGYEVCSLVKNETMTNKQIKTIKIPKRKKGKGRIRLQLYSIDKDGMPGEPLLVKSVVIDGSDYKKELIFDISKHGIYLPSGGVYVGIEWLDSYHYTGDEDSIEVKTNTLNENTYVRHVFRGFQWNTSRVKQLAISIDLFE